ncbi:hypothetical protein D3C87_1954560 [compost metagenome]
MQLGNSAGIAAAMAAKQQKTVQTIDVPALQARLKEKGVIISIDHQVWDGEKDVRKK